MHHSIVFIRPQIQSNHSTGLALTNLFTAHSCYSAVWWCHETIYSIVLVIVSNNRLSLINPHEEVVGYSHAQGTTESPSVPFN